MQRLQSGTCESREKIAQRAMQATDAGRASLNGRGKRQDREIKPEAGVQERETIRAKSRCKKGANR